MKGTYKKGRRAELEYAEILRNEGYEVEIAPKGNRFSKQKDFFGHWDIIAFKKIPGVNLGHWLVVQVKCNTTGGVLKKLEEAANGLPPGTDKVLAIRKDGCGRKKPVWDVRTL